MSRSRDLANLAGDATGLETLTVSDITDLTSTAAELNKLDGVTASTAELNKLDGVTADTAELNKLDGVTASTAELNYVDGVTSAVQTQINSLGSKTVPHIIPGVLYPAVGGNDIHGTDIDTSHGSTYTYGTTHTDGRKYYYTDIKGSKPIKDPRIGGHFGSQRHKFKSLQLLEQETATEGVDVYAVDGREWMRARGDCWTVPNNANGHFLEPSNRLKATDSQFIEIVGFFNDANILHWSSSTTHDQFGVVVNGGTRQNNDLAVNVAPPLSGRYVDSGSVSNLTFNATPTLGINTLKISNTTEAYFSVFGIELIAQDKFTDATCDYNNDPTITHDANTRIVAGLSVSGTGIPANATVASVTSSTEFELSVATTGGAVTNGTLTFGASNIQIPSQDVVSYGKKFTVSGIPHYDPFNGFTSGSSVSSYIDTATSLGVEKWKNSSTYYRPYNGGRVVKWVDSSGVIKTSVTLMPPNAKSIADSSSLTNGTAKANASIANNTFYPTFEAHTTDVNEDLLHEVAKTFHLREFGNGAANTAGGDGKGGNADETWADASMLSGTDDFAYVMDDGLTSMSAKQFYGTGNNGSIRYANSSDGEHIYITFIGTGYQQYVEGETRRGAVVQNLPYGTHIVKLGRATGSSKDIDVDGVKIIDNTLGDFATFLTEFTFFQPKKPLIPEDACVLADFMLMADFVPQTSAGIDKISKGVRSVSASRDFFIDDTGSNTLALDLSVTHRSGFKISSGSSSDSDETITFRLPSFGTNYVSRGYQHDTRKLLYLDTTPKDSDSTKDNTATEGSYAHLTANLDLGVYKFGTNIVNGQYPIFEGFDVATPIHTSSHYQPFETPYLHELVSGDRNMEQHNLVCSPDGKTWDQITRDTSYIGKGVLSANNDTDRDDGSAIIIMDEWRGTASGEHNPNFNKDWAIAYDRVICLVDGQYEFNVQTLGTSSASAGFMHNGTVVVKTNASTDTQGTQSQAVLNCQRGDYIQVLGDWYQNEVYNNYTITRL